MESNADLDSVTSSAQRLLLYQEAARGSNSCFTCRRASSIKGLMGLVSLKTAMVTGHCLKSDRDLCIYDDIKRQYGGKQKL